MKLEEYVVEKYKHGFRRSWRETPMRQELQAILQSIGWESDTESQIASLGQEQVEQCLTESMTN